MDEALQEVLPESVALTDGPGKLTHYPLSITNYIYLSAMSRHFLANLSIILLLNLVVKPIYIFGIEISVQNTVGAETYGLYFAILNSAYLLQVLNDFGLQIYNNRNVALSADNLRNSFVPILRLKTALSLGFIALFAVLTGVLGYWKEWQLVIPVGINLVLMSLVLFLRSNISGLGLYRRDSILSVLDKLLLIVILGYLLFLSDVEFSILHFAYAQTVALSLTALTAIFFLYAKNAFNGERTTVEKTTSILRQAAPYALAVFMMTIYTRIDGVMIEQIAQDGAYQSGAYAAGYRLLDAANMFAYLFAVLLLPMFTRSLENLQVIRTLLSQGARVMLALTVIGASVCIAYRTEIMALLYTQATVEWANIFALLIASFVAIGGMYIFGTYLTARGEIRQLNIIYLFCVLLNVILNFILIPTKGALGAAVATLATQTAATIALLLLTIDKTRLSIRASSLIIPLLFVAITIALSYGSTQLDGIQWWLRFAGTAILSGVLALTIGLIRPSELGQFIGVNTQ